MAVMSYALVTGPTSGIGAAFARLLAREGYDLVLVARNTARMQALADELHSSLRIKCETITADLTTEDGMRAVEERLADETRPIEVLVNNAGFGLKDPFYKSTVADELGQLTILVTAPLRFTHAAVPRMIARGRGYIINVGSVAAFIPANTYSSAKAWLTNFTESLHEQLQDTGVHATVVAPGYTHTEFHQRAGMDMSALPEALWLDANAVAAQAWADVIRDRPVSIPSWQYQTLSFAARYLPRPVIRKVANRRPGPNLRRDV